MTTSRRTRFSKDAELTPAFILHTRKYRDTSLIAEILTERDGRVAAVIRGARANKKKSGVVQAFTPLLVSYVGRGELKTVTKIDTGTVARLVGENLLIGLYVNELLVRLLGKYEPVGSLFAAYQDLVLNLISGNPSSGVLRGFELNLLSELGYEVTFDLDASTGLAVEADQYYRYVPDEGFHSLIQDTSNATYKGEYLLAIADGDFDTPAVDNCAKKIVRASLAVLLGDKPLKSREMFELYQSRTRN
jgi:DNA repair protein RecO (recombination protein O)